jgi:hypothetical protein
MKTIQFISDDKKELEFSETLKKRINEYFKSNNISQKGNFWMYLKAFILLTTYILSFVILILFPIGPWLGILMAILMGIGEAGIGMSVMHDAAHGAFSKKKMGKFLFRLHHVYSGKQCSELENSTQLAPPHLYQYLRLRPRYFDQSSYSFERSCPSKKVPSVSIHIRFFALWTDDNLKIVQRFNSTLGIQ